MPDLEPHYAQAPLEAFPPKPRLPLHVVLDNLRSAYNVGSIFRTADAAGVCHLHLCGMSAHPPHKKIAKTSLGAYEYVPWTYYERTSDALEALAGQGVPTVAIETADNAQPLDKVQWPQPVAVVLGNEVTGINEKTLKLCGTVAAIPMLGYKNSINVATAAGIVFYDVLRQWGAA